jgi:hypothetical protein
MLIVRISIEINGEHFYPNELLCKIKDEISVFFTQEPDNSKDIIGVISILSPKKIGVEYKLDDYHEWYIDFIEKYYHLFIEEGAEQINVLYDVFYSTQCNFEIFNSTLLNRLNKYHVSIPVSVYKISNDKIVEILSDAGYSKAEIEELAKNV